MFTKADQLASVFLYFSFKKKTPFSGIKRHLMEPFKHPPHILLLIIMLFCYQRLQISAVIHKGGEGFSKHFSNLLISQLAENRKDAPL